MRKKELKIIALIISLFIFLSNVNSTYSKYVTGSNNNIDANFSRWKVLVSNSNVYSNYVSSIDFTPVIDSNANVRSGKIAPGSTGHFDIYIDCSGVTTSFQYIIEITYPSTNDLDNLKATGYSILPVVNGTPVESNATTTALTNTNTISETKIWNDTEFSPYVVRIYFEWQNGANNSTDTSDTTIGTKAANNETINYSMEATLAFTQYVPPS